MTQEIYNIIVKIIQTGAPALANELITSINNLLNDNRKLAQEVLDLKKEKETNAVKEEE